MTLQSCIPESILRDHVARLTDLMRSADYTAVIVFHPSNMVAFTGTPHSSSDRLTCAAVTREGAVVVVAPAFERPSVAGAEGFAEITTWDEHEDQYACFAGALRRAGVTKGTLGLDGRTWIDAAARFKAACPWARFESAEALLREVRLCKTPAEQEAMRAAHRRGERVYFILKELIRPGISELELQRALAARCERDGLRIGPMILSGPNGAFPHKSTGDRVLQDGDTVVVDSVTNTHGYTNDLTRTFAIGQPSDKAKRAYRAVRAAQAAVFETARPGIACRVLDEIARKVITDAGFGEFFTHRLGHGIGIECHEPPYLDGGNEELLRPGVCCTVEPGVYVPGEFGIRIEDDMLITTGGAEVIRGELPTDVTAAFDQA